MSAVISPCGKYRYVLTRSLGSALRWYKPIVFVMLNPSTADANLDDPTIRRCISFAEREGKTHLKVLNLFAYRSTDPAELARVAAGNFDEAVGPENDKYLDEHLACLQTTPVIAAWGAHKIARHRALWLVRKYGPFQCLGLTRAGQPRHPLYVSGKQELLTFSGEA